MQRESELPLDINFSTEELIRSLRNNPLECESLAEALSETDPKKALAAVSQYFRRRSGPLVFHSCEKIAHMVGEVPSLYPDWRDRTLEQVKREAEEGLMVYGMKTPPLKGDYPWGGGHDNPGKDIQYSKRPHRFSFLPRMALASLYESTQAENLETVLVSWIQFAETSDESRLAYDSNLAVIQRLMASTWSWLYLCSQTTSESVSLQRVECLLLKIIYTDIRFLMPRLGKSYANNHLLADYFAGWFIGRIFPEFAGSSIQEDDYEQLWADELLRQTYEDGWSFEHSIHYHEFACDMGLCYLLLSRKNGWPISQRVEQRVTKMLQLQVEVTSVSGNPVRIGDCIEENFFPLGVHEGLGPRLYREVYRALFDSSEAPSELSLPDVEVAYWLLGGLVEATAELKSSGVAAFEQGGLYCLADSKTEMELLFRTGPAEGTNICAGHADSDWMSIYLSVSGEPVVVDVGTYSYRSKPERWPENEPAWRHYMRAPESHNGVVMLGNDPLGAVEGDFRPKLIDARVKSQLHTDTPLASWVSGEFKNAPLFDGYARGVVCIHGHYMLVYDQHPEVSELSWSGMQFAPKANVCKSLEGLGLKLDSVEFSLSNGFSDIELLCGSTEPMGGWIAERYGVLSKAPQARLNFDHTAKQTAVLITPAGLGEGRLEVDQNATFDIFKITFGEVEDCLILSNKLDYTATDYRALSFEAELVWVRHQANRATELRAANVKSISLANDISINFPEREAWVSVDLAGAEPVVQTASGKQP